MYNIYIYIYMYICIYIYIHTFTYACPIHIHNHACSHTHTHVYIHANTYAQVTLAQLKSGASRPLENQQTYRVPYASSTATATKAPTQSPQRTTDHHTHHSKPTYLQVHASISPTHSPHTSAEHPMQHTPTESHMHTSAHSTGYSVTSPVHGLVTERSLAGTNTRDAHDVVYSDHYNSYTNHYNDDNTNSVGRAEVSPPTDHHRAESESPGRFGEEDENYNEYDSESKHHRHIVDKSESESESEYVTRGNDDSSSGHVHSANRDLARVKRLMHTDRVQRHDDSESEYVYDPEKNMHMSESDPDGDDVGVKRSAHTDVHTNEGDDGKATGAKKRELILKDVDRFQASKEEEVSNIPSGQKLNTPGQKLSDSDRFQASKEEVVSNIPGQKMSDSDRFQVRSDGADVRSKSDLSDKDRFSTSVRGEGDCGGDAAENESESNNLIKSEDDDGLNESQHARAIDANADDDGDGQNVSQHTRGIDLKSEDDDGQQHVRGVDAKVGDGSMWERDTEKSDAGVHVQQPQHDDHLVLPLSHQKDIVRAVDKDAVGDSEDGGVHMQYKHDDASAAKRDTASVLVEKFDHDDGVSAAKRDTASVLVKRVGDDEGADVGHVHVQRKQDGAPLARIEISSVHGKQQQQQSDDSTSVARKDIVNALDMHHVDDDDDGDAMDVHVRNRSGGDTIVRNADTRVIGMQDVEQAARKSGDGAHTHTHTYAHEDASPARSIYHSVSSAHARSHTHTPTKRHDLSTDAVPTQGHDISTAASGTTPLNKSPTKDPVSGGRKSPTPLFDRSTCKEPASGGSKSTHNNKDMTTSFNKEANKSPNSSNAKTPVRKSIFSATPKHEPPDISLRHRGSPDTLTSSSRRANNNNATHVGGGRERDVAGQMNKNSGSSKDKSESKRRPNKDGSESKRSPHKEFSKDGSESKRKSAVKQTGPDSSLDSSLVDVGECYEGSRSILSLAQMLAVNSPDMNLRLSEAYSGLEDMSLGRGEVTSPMRYVCIYIYVCVCVCV
jgi:hypothetical protein